MKNTSCEYEAIVLVNGRPVTEVAHSGRTYIEGRVGSNYEIQFKNHSSSRVLVIPSVDGLSVLDGKPCGINSQGYVIWPKSDLVIPGWTVDSKTAAKFAFAAQGRDNTELGKQTYVEAIGGDPTNQGAIGFLVFKEKSKPKPQRLDEDWFKPTPVVVPPIQTIPMPYPVPYPVPTPAPYPWVRPQIYYGSNNLGNMGSGGSLGRSAGNTTFDLNSVTLSDASAGGMSAGGSASSMMAQNAAPQAADPNNMTSSVVGCDHTYDSGLIGHEIEFDLNESEDSSIGTGFGEATNFATHKVEFERASTSPSDVLIIYYDTLKGLKRKGVPIEAFQVHQTQTYVGPNPFPASPSVLNTGCKPPKGWKK